MEAYSTLLKDLDAQIEQGLVLFEKKWENAVDEPVKDEPVKDSPEEKKPTEPQTSSWFTPIKNFSPIKNLAQAFYTEARSEAIKARVEESEKTKQLPPLTEEQKAKILNEAQSIKQGITPVNRAYNKQLSIKKGGSRKRKGPTGNRTRIAGFKVLSAKPLHHKTKK